MIESNLRERLSLALKLAAIGGAIAVCGASIGCETTEGAGRDLENLGDNIEDAAEDND